MWFKNYYESNVKGYMTLIIKAAMFIAYIWAIFFTDNPGDAIHVIMSLCFFDGAATLDLKRETEKMVDIADRNDRALNSEIDELKEKVRELENEKFKLRYEICDLTSENKTLKEQAEQRKVHYRLQ